MSDEQKQARPRSAVVGTAHVYVFIPQPDITVIELSVAMEMLLCRIAEGVDKIYELEPAVHRHFTVQDIPPQAQAPKIAVPRPNAFGAGLQLPGQMPDLTKLARRLPGRR